MDTGTVMMIAMPIIFLGLLLTEYFLLKKHYDSGIKELKMKYEGIVEETRKETERKIRESFFKESIKVERTIIPTNQYEETIIIDYNDINLLHDEKELMEILRSGFADRFAKEVIKPNLVINETIDIVPNKKKYMAKMWMGF